MKKRKTSNIEGKEIFTIQESTSPFETMGQIINELRDEIIHCLSYFVDDCKVVIESVKFYNEFVSETEDTFVIPIITISVVLNSQITFDTSIEAKWYPVYTLQQFASIIVDCLMSKFDNQCIKLVNTTTLMK